VTLDAAGNLYVADFYHNAVKKIKADIYSIEPVLPAGLTMDPQTGIISGTPMQATPTTTYTVTTQNGAGVATTTLSFSTSAPLPVNWIALNGHLSKNQNAVLNWQVAENSVASFEIQKSAGNNKDSSFRTIGAVVSQGNGTNNYSFTDPQVFNGNSLYRIAETDHDGKRSYSPVISLTGITQVAIQVYPNPTKNKITVVIPANLLNTDASLINMIGKVIQTVHLSDLSNQVSLQSLSSGLYVLRFKDGSSRQIIKQ